MTGFYSYQQRFRGRDDTHRCFRMMPTAKQVNSTTTTLNSSISIAIGYKEQVTGQKIVFTCAKAILDVSADGIAASQWTTAPRSVFLRATSMTTIGFHALL